MGTTDAAAVYSANPATDEFGIGSAPASRLGYLGGAERFTTDANLGIIRMGVRLYDPTLGRFLQTDPIPGGSANNYDYANQDPVNGFDLGGDISFCSDDYCGAAQASHQSDNPESPLNISYDFINANQHARENLAIDNAPYYGKTTFAKAAIGTVQIFGQYAGYAAVAAAAVGTGGIDLGVIGGIGAVGAGTTAGVTCTARGWVTKKCAGDEVATGVAVASTVLGPSADRRVFSTAITRQAPLGTTFQNG